MSPVGWGHLKPMTYEKMTFDEAVFIWNYFASLESTDYHHGYLRVGKVRRDIEGKPLGAKGGRIKVHSALVRLGYKPWVDGVLRRQWTKRRKLLKKELREQTLYDIV